MFRMLQTLEREPQEDMAPMYDVSPAPGRMPGMVIELNPRVLISYLVTNRVQIFIS